jgi:hypothetical protein
MAVRAVTRGRRFGSRWSLLRSEPGPDLHGEPVSAFPIPHFAIRLSSGRVAPALLLPRERGVEPGEGDGKWAGHGETTGSIPRRGALH